MRCQRGVTLIELLVVVFASSALLLGFGAFFWRMTSASTVNEAQVGMQRRASLIQQEFSRIVQGADNVFAGTCGPSATSGLSVPVRVPAKMLPETTTPTAADKYFCFYFSGSSGDFVQCQFTSPSSTACSARQVSLLSGEPSTRTIKVIPTTCAVTPALPNAGFGVINNSLIRACFQLQAVSGTKVLAGPLDYEIKASIRN